MKLTDKMMPVLRLRMRSEAMGQYQQKDLGHHNYPRIVFRCPDKEWSFWFNKWKREEINIEPFPYKHTIWGE